MNLRRQVASLLHIRISEIWSAPGSAIVTIGSAAIAVGVLTAMLSMSAGSKHLALSNVRPDRAVIRIVGSTTITNSDVPRNDAKVVSDAPEVRLDGSGIPMVSAEIIATLPLRRRRDNVAVKVPLYGVGSEYVNIHPELKIEEGRLFKAGLNELLIGENVPQRYKGGDVGSRIRLGGADWLIVGRYSVNGPADNAILGDDSTLMSSLHRTDYQQLTVMLRSAGDFQRFAKTISGNPALELEVLHEREAADDDSKALNLTLKFLSYFVGGIMAVGATLGAMNAIYASVEHRRRELATIRALGFHPAAFLFATLSETTICSLIGGAIGAVAVRVIFNGHLVAPLGSIFPLVVTYAVEAIGLSWALIIGLLAGFLPALQLSVSSVIEDMSTQ